MDKRRKARRRFPWSLLPGPEPDPRVPELKEKVRTFRHRAGSLQTELASLRKQHRVLERNFGTLQKRLDADRVRRDEELRLAAAERGDLERRLAEIERAPQASDALAADRALQKHFLEFRSHFLPKRAIGYDKIRIGRNGDGGYPMIDDFDGILTAISGGIGAEVSWDSAIADRGIDVIQVDYTVPGPPVAHPRFSFLAKRLVGTRGDVQDITLTELIAACPGEGDTVLLQIDIEGSEWDVFDRPIPGLERCRQIVMEFHDLASFGDRVWRERAIRGVRQLTAAHQCIHVHGNNGGLAPMIIVGGVPFPSVWEATFVLKSRYRFTQDTESYPTALDAPNNSRRAQHFLGRLGYELPPD